MTQNIINSSNQLIQDGWYSIIRGISQFIDVVSDLTYDGIKTSGPALIGLALPDSYTVGWAINSGCLPPYLSKDETEHSSTVLRYSGVVVYVFDMSSYDDRWSSLILDRLYVQNTSYINPRNLEALSKTVYNHGSRYYHMENNPVNRDTLLEDTLERADLYAENARLRKDLETLQDKVENQKNQIEFLHKLVDMLLESILDRA